MPGSANDIFVVDNLQNRDGQITADLVLNEHNPILEGHFPDRPVVPGACILALVKDVLQAALTQEVRLKSAGNIKFMQMITPQDAKNTRLTITCKTAQPNSISVNASIINGETTCFKLQAVFSVL